MNCPRCERANPDHNKFCTYCGTTLTTDSSQSPDVHTQREHRQLPSLTELVEKIRSLENELVTIRSALVKHGLLSATNQTESLSREITYSRLEERVSPTPVAEESESPNWSSSWTKINFLNWERVLGLNWLAIVGSIALVVGIGFFLKLAFENNWIGETGRVVLGLTTGIILIGIGEYSQRRYPAWAQAISGGGIAILYLSIYATFGFFKLLDPVPAFLLITLIVITSGILALRYESLTIALIGILGAYITPILFGNDLEPDNSALVLAYVLIINLGLLFISTFRNWRWLTLIGLIASYTLFLLWAGNDLFEPESTEHNLILAQTGLTSIFLVFVGATTLFHLIWKRTPGPLDLSLMLLNITAYYFLTVYLLWDEYQSWFGLITLSLSIFYGLISLVAIKRPGTSPLLTLYSLAVAMILLTMAIPVQLKGTWITVAWSAEGIVLIWLGFVSRSWVIRRFALVVLAGAALRLIGFDTSTDLTEFQMFFNGRFATFSFTILALYLGAFIYRREKNSLEQWEGNIGLILIAVANILTLWILSTEIMAYFDSRALVNNGGATYQEIENRSILALTALWSIYAFGLLGIAFAKRSVVFRWAGLILLLVPILKLMMIDTFVIELNPDTFKPVLNFYFVTYLVVLLSTLLCAYLYKRRQEDLTGRERHVLTILIIIANLTSVWIFSTEVLRFFEFREAKDVANFSNAKHLVLTVMWAMYATAVIGVGIGRRSSKLRIAGLAMLCIPVFKLFGFDVFQLDSVYRVSAFITLGILLITAGLAYQLYNKRIKEFLISDA